MCRYWQAKCNGVTPLAFLKQGVHPRSNKVTATFLFPYRHALRGKSILLALKSNSRFLDNKYITYVIMFPAMFHVSK